MSRAEDPEHSIACGHRPMCLDWDQHERIELKRYGDMQHYRWSGPEPRPRTDRECFYCDAMEGSGLEGAGCRNRGGCTYLRPGRRYPD